VIPKPRQILSIVSTLNWPPRRAVVWIVEYDIPHFFANTQMKALIDVFGNDVETKAVDSEHFTAWIKVCVSPTFLRWVFGWNGLVKIVSPQKVCEDYRQMLENALEIQKL